MACLELDHYSITIIDTPIFIQRLRNLSSSLLLIAAVGGFYAAIPYFQRYFSAHTHFFAEDFTRWQVLLTVTLGYIFLLLVFYLSEKSPGISKPILCLRALRRLATSPQITWRRGLPADERLGLLSVLLKAFFAPLMVVWLFDHTALMLEQWGRVTISLGKARDGLDGIVQRSWVLVSIQTNSVFRRGFLPLAI